MDEHRPGEGGSANTPPFPRIVPHDESERQSADPRRGQPPGEIEAERVTDEIVAGPVTDGPDIGAAGEAGASQRGAHRDTANERSGATGAPREKSTGRRHARSARVRRPNRAFEEIAEHLEDAAERLDQFASSQLGAIGGSGRAAGAATEAIEDFAAYLRSSDLKSVRDDLSRQMRDKPVQTLLVAVGAGWFVGKVIR